MIRPCQKVLIAAVVLLMTGAETSAQSRAPQFTDYGVRTVHKGANAPVKLSRNDRAFRTRIRGASKDKPNFAGEYILAQWGCGAECLSTVVINARTGKVYGLPFSICCWSSEVDPVDFDLHSRLLIVRGLRNESEKDGESDTHYYEFSGGQFRFIRTIKKP